MEYWFANIDINKIKNIEKASKEAKIDFRKGPIMTSTESGPIEKETKVEKYYPLFCKNREEGKVILSKYFEVIGEASKLYLEHKEHFIARMIGGRI